MPEHSGLDLLQWIQESPGIPTGLRIFACTANAGSDAVKEFEAAGFEGGSHKAAGSSGAREVLGVAVRPRIRVLALERLLQLNGNRCLCGRYGTWTMSATGGDHDAKRTY